MEKLRPDDVGNAGDVDIPGGEGGGHRGLSHWKRYAWKDIGIDTLEYLKKWIISILVLKQTRFYQRGRFLVLRSHCSHLHTWSLVDCILIQVWFNFWIIFKTRVSTFQIKLLRCSMFYKEQLWILPQTLEALNQLNLLLWQHPGKDLSSVDDPLEQLGVLSRCDEDRYKWVEYLPQRRIVKI